MSVCYTTKIWLHVIFSTKNRASFINSSIEQDVYDYMRDQLIALGCPVRIINGMPDHVHLLYLQSPKYSISQTLKQIKGATSRWLNEQQFSKDKFQWQRGYAAFSVSQSQLEKAYKYILHQKRHHKKRDFVKESNVLLRLHNIKNEMRPQKIYKGE